MRLVKQKPKYKCDFCKKIAGIKAITRHERVCYKNPNRECDMCYGEGRMERGYLGENLGYVSDDDVCYACSNAYEAGGKHYLSEKDAEIVQLRIEEKQRIDAGCQ